MLAWDEIIFLIHTFSDKFRCVFVSVRGLRLPRLVASRGSRLLPELQVLNSSAMKTERAPKMNAFGSFEEEFNNDACGVPFVTGTNSILPK